MSFSKSESEKKLREALSMHHAGRFTQAKTAYGGILKQQPDNASALQYLGVLEASLGNLEVACSLMARSSEIEPSNIQFLENYATILYQTGRYETAFQTCDKGLRLSSASVAVNYIRALALYRLKQFDDSLAQFDKLLSLQPQHIAGINERGSVLAEMGRYDAAISAFQKALALAPNYAEAYLNCGSLFGKLHRVDEALAAFDRALAIKPQLEDAWLGYGNILGKLKRYDEAFAAYDKALALKPDLEGAWLGRGNVFTALKRHDDAFAAYDRALALKPDSVGAEGARLNSIMHLCDWSHVETFLSHLISSVRDGKENTEPFVTLGVSDSPEFQLKCACLWVSKKFPPVATPLWKGNIYKHDKIRVGYVSADFHQHATAYLMAETLECHNREKFETVALSIGPDDRSSMRQRLEGSFNKFLDCRTLGDAEIATEIRNTEIDLLVDLKGFTQDARTNIFAYRPAPIQVNYLGYPGTMGAGYIDYIIGDNTIFGPTHQKFYSEKLVRLPHTYQPNDRKRTISDTIFSRAECELPETGFVFCCFNSNYKILPSVFDGWMRILKRVPGSVLWLIGDHPKATANLRREAAIRDISPDRLIFAKRTLPPEHLARHRLANLFLDTSPYNAHTTASDALWAGLPVLTQIGETFAGRVAASLLSAIGLPELIVSSEKEYEDLAVGLAVNPLKLAEIIKKLKINRLTSPLFNTELFTRHLESAFEAMYSRYQAGFAPDHITVPEIKL
jgi:predicted O-linked N-acetylglucosamine transferase (SPINDLY family)